MLYLRILVIFLWAKIKKEYQRLYGKKKKKAIWIRRETEWI